MYRTYITVSFESLLVKPHVLQNIKLMIIKMAERLLTLLKTAASIRRTCCEVFYVPYKMIRRHLPRWLDRVLNLLNVPSVQLHTYIHIYIP